MLILSLLANVRKSEQSSHNERLSRPEVSSSSIRTFGLATSSRTTLQIG